MLATLLSGCGVTFHRVRDGEQVSLPDVLGEVSGKQVAYLGEIHDRKEFHDLQALVIRDLTDRGEKVAIALEMFRADHQWALDGWIGGKIDREEFIPVYKRNWRNIDWSFYEEIFLLARERNIPMIGLNVPAETAAKVFRSGCASLTKEDHAGLPSGTDCRVDNREVNDLLRSFPLHDMDADGVVRLTEAQALRNRGMARRLAAYMAGNPDRKVLVLAGGGHVRRSVGIPREMRVLGITDDTIVIPVFPPAITVEDATAAEADFIVEESPSLIRMRGR